MSPVASERQDEGDNQKCKPHKAALDCLVESGRPLPMPVTASRRIKDDSNDALLFIRARIGQASRHSLRHKRYVRSAPATEFRILNILRAALRTVHSSASNPCKAEFRESE